MDWTFTATPRTFQTPNVPFFEDATKDFAPYYSSRLKPDQARAEVADAFALLGGDVTRFQDGVFEIGGRKRFGYEIYFDWGGNSGVLRVAGLPIRMAVTETKKNAVLTQALLNVRDWLKTSITQKTFSPGSSPLIGHLLVGETGKTLIEMMAETGRFPLLGDGKGS